MWNWSSKFGWDKIIAEHDARVNEKLNERLVNQSVNKLESIVKDLQDVSYLALKKVTNALNKDLIKPIEDTSQLKQLVDSVNTAIKSHALLVGSATSRSETINHNNNVSNKKVIKEKVMSIVTDSSGVNEVKNTDCTLFKIYCLFLDENAKLELADKFQTPGTGYSEIKKELFSTIMEHFELFRQKRDYYEQHQDQVHDILKQGAEKASAVAETFLTPVRDVTGLNYKA